MTPALTTNCYRNVAQTRSRSQSSVPGMARHGNDQREVIGGGEEEEDEEE